MLIDAGTQLHDIPDERITRAILKRASEFKVGRFISIALSPEDWSLATSVVRQEEQVVPFFGIHPWYVDGVSPESFKQLSHVLSMNCAAGIGTIGLDRSEKGGDYEKQKEVFLHQIQLAEKLSRPIAIYCARDCEDLLTFLHDHKLPGIRFMVRDYQGSSGILDRLLKLGAYISFSRKNLLNAGSLMLNLVNQVPKDRLLLETGFPFMVSDKIKERGDSEMYFKCLQETYALAAQAIEIDVSELEEIIWNNSNRYLFNEAPQRKKK